MFKQLESNTLVKGAACTAAIAFGGMIVRKLVDKLDRRMKNYPPGTNGLPVLGSLLSLQDPIFLDYLRNSFGAVSMINIGSNRCIMINDLKLCKKLYNQEEFINHNFNLFNKTTFMEINGKEMLFRRKLIQSTFLTLINNNYLNTIGLKLIQQNLFPLFDIAIDAQDHNRKKDEEKGNVRNNYNNNLKNLKIQKDIEYGIFCITFSAIFGDKYINVPKRESKKFVEFSENLEIVMQSMFLQMSLNICGFSTSISHIINYFFGSKFQSGSKKFNQMIHDWINQFWTKFNNGDNNNNDDNINNVTLVSMMKAMESKQVSKQDIISDIGIIFLGSIDTVSTRLVKSLKILAQNSEVEQLIYDKIVQHERDMSANLKNENRTKNVNASVNVNVHDIAELRAFVYEVIRHECGFAAPRCIMNKNVQINGYNIPKNCMILANYDAFNKDSKYWKNRKDFDLNNWLNDKTGKFVNNSALSSFGIGKRNCPGKTLAIREMIIILACLIKRYQFSLDTNGDIIINRRKYNLAK